METSSFDAVRNPKPGWYRGDLHAHTTFSDGALSPQELVALAKEEGLDYLAITDHNTIGAFKELPPTNQVLVLPGAEITLDKGHFNAFGTAGHQGWMDGLFTWPRQVREADLKSPIGDLIREISRSGPMVSINHPLLAPWAWLMESVEVSSFDCLEVWNDPSWPDNRLANPAALEMWTRWLNEGHRVTAVGGSDYHRPQPNPGMDKPAERLGFPSTYIFAEKLSIGELVKGLRNMQAYVSLGPQVSFNARSAGRTYPIGTDMGTLSGTLEIRASLAGWEGRVTGRIIRKGACVFEAAGSADGLQLRYQEKLDGRETCWHRLDVLGDDGQVLAFTNPVFSGPRRIPKKMAFGEFL